MKTRGAVALAKWIETKGKTQTWVGLRVGVRQSSISALVSGTFEPSLETAIRLEKLTGIGVALWIQPVRRVA
jgi:plasmid maintenance system antidote protein VapI